MSPSLKDPTRRSRAKKWNSEDSEDSEDSDPVSSDGQGPNRAGPATSSDEDDDQTSPREERLGRGARTRAKVSFSAFD